MFRRLLIVSLLTASLAWADDYQVVIKSSGKVLRGELVAEDAQSLTLNVNGAEMKFKKERLDLERMKTLNAPLYAPGAKRTPVPTRPEIGLGPLAGQKLSPAQAQSIRQTYAENINELSERLANDRAELARLRSEPPSADRDKRMIELEGDIRSTSSRLEDLKLQAGVSENPGAVQGERLVRELEADEAHQTKAYFDAIHAKAPQSELDHRMKELQRLRRQLVDAREALARAKAQ